MLPIHEKSFQGPFSRKTRKKSKLYPTPVLLSNQDDNCRTVLHHATRPAKWGYFENAEILKLLIERGASISDEDVHGKSALDYALEGGSGKLANVLQGRVLKSEGIFSTNFFEII